MLDSEDTGAVLTCLAVLAETTLSPAIPALDCSITLIRPKKHPVQASSGTLARSLDELQDSLGEGPTLMAIMEHRTVTAPDLAEDDRWPRLAAIAPRRGIQSALGVPLNMDGQDRAVLSLTSSRTHHFSHEEIRTAEAFAARASRVLRTAVRIARLNDTVQALHGVLKHRTVIDTALGVVMSQNSCDHDTAFAILQRAASTRNAKLRDVATSIVASVSGQSTTRIHFEP